MKTYLQQSLYDRWTDLYTQLVTLDVDNELLMEIDELLYSVWVENPEIEPIAKPIY